MEKAFDPPPDKEFDLPADFGRRVRAARAYMEDDLSQKDFGERLDRSGMRPRTVRAWEAGHFPPSMAREPIVRRLSEVSGLPPAFFTADLTGLFEDIPPSVDARLTAIQQGIDQLAEWPESAIKEAIKAMTTEDLVAYAEAILERRDAQSRGDVDPSPGSSEAAA